MDPNALSNLDPKLRETYERVMGSPAAAADNPPPPTKDVAQEQHPGVSQPVNTTESTATPILENSAPSEQPQTVTINQPLPNPVASTVISQPHGHMGLIKILYFLGGIVFFVVYIFFWMKIFDISLPF